MLANLFSLIQLILKAFQVWEAFLDHVDERDVAAREERRQKRQQAIDDSKKAEGDDAIWDSQDRIIDNRPKP